MARPSLTFIAVAGVATLAGAVWFLGFRRTPACTGDGRYMATAQQCRAYGVDAGLCASAVEQARALAVKVAPRTDASFDCEVRFSECFAGPDGRFTPTPSFCLAPGSAQPKEVRYLEYESDRLNRKKTREVRID
ncbi:DUF1190 domain-containing protein [Methylosinus sp. Ce-a6]|uniref:DUF1190 domain-containing protein n=1 Tax=Methylosinus sp. Ce-a6 TaxID=2172005 RepID=UPI00135789F3|nr:DUF1190 domain-containing protein [Methylosinus sp. Ce-a6]